jgi:predicted SAM-dependent methyltransferase
VSKTSEKNFLNLGCGYRFINGWTNIDFVSTGEGVVAHNLTKGIPCPDNQFDVVYHSHVLEHMDITTGQFFMSECYRVLKKGGVIRVVVPNLEEIAKQYLGNLENALAGKVNAAQNYDWAVIELFDQMIRRRSGGEMAKVWMQENLPNEAHIANRLGSEFRNFRNSYKQNKAKESVVRSKLSWREKLLKWISGEEQVLDWIETGRFRASGEIHQWMYDRFSLTRLLKNCNFSSIRQVDAFTSSIPDWPLFQKLDIELDQVRKPDSIFMEAVK